MAAAPQPPVRTKRTAAVPASGDGDRKVVRSIISDGFTGLCKVAARHFPLVLGVYLLGYFRMSVAWLVGLVGFTAARHQWKKEHDFRMQAARASVLSDEKEVITARVSDLPSWVFFPDFDRAEWLNKILSQVWPNVGHYARNIIIESVEPGIRESLASYKLGGFKLDKISLGTVPFRVGGVKVYDRNVARGEIIMDVEILYAGDCDIRFRLKGLKGGVKDFQLAGMLRVVMKPLISQIPLVGGLQIFFLNSPTIDFNLIGVADVLDMPGLSDILRRVIVDQIGHFLVLPNKLCLSLSNEVAPEILKIPEPAGVLRIRLIEAKKLMKMDVGLLGMGKSDPYAIITIGSQEFRTKTIHNTINPRWDFYCEAKVESLRAQILFIQLWDWDQGFPGMQNDDYLGRATVDIFSVAKAGKKDMWVTLEDVKTGMVHLEMTWFSLHDDPSLLKLHLAETQSLGLSSALLIVYVDSAKLLPSAKTTTKPDPYVVASVGNKKEQTSARMRTTDPVYEQALTFLVCNPESDDLHLKVLDQKTGHELGYRKITLVSLLTLPGLTLPPQPLGLKNSGPDSKLIVSVHLKVMMEDTAEVELADEPTPAAEAEPAAPAEAAAAGDAVAAAAAAAAVIPVKKEDAVAASTNGNLKEEDAASVKEEAVSADAVSTATAAAAAATATTATHLGLPTGCTSKIQMTLRYSTQRQRLVIVIHKASQLPGADLVDLPDPYVKLYLLPDRGSNGKRKTDVVRDSVNPIFDETVEYPLAPSDVASRELEVSVINRKGLFARSPLLGQTRIALDQIDLSQAVTQWFDLSADA